MLTGMKLELVSAFVVVAACGHPATPKQPTPGPPSASGPPAVSLERLERIARACLADRTDPALDWPTIGFAQGADGWRVRVGETRAAGREPTYVDIVIDAEASTCDGKAVPSQPESGDAGVDAITAIARRCHTGKVDPGETEIAYHRLTTGDIDHGRFDVVFHEPGVAITQPVPHYLVDFPASTCKRLDDGS